MEITTTVKDNEGNIINEYTISVERTPVLERFLSAWVNMDISHRTFHRLAQKNNIKYQIK